MPNVTLCDCGPSLDSFHDEVIRGLQQTQKTLPCKFFYDERGSRLFDQICDLPEYYPTRTEVAIMEAHIGEIASLLGPGRQLAEYGSGSSLKTRILLDNAPDLMSYAPIDISREHLYNSVLSLTISYPNLEILPICADYTQEFSLPLSRRPVTQHVVYFPGSTIGNFEPESTQAFLRRIALSCGFKGGLLIGVDLQKDPRILERAYNDAQGVTAAFNLNLLARINRELGGDFNLNLWEHSAVYHEAHQRIEMRLVSRCEQQAHIGDTTIHFDAQESIHTESSYKYSLSGFAKLAAKSGWEVQQVWVDDAELFSVQYLTVSEEARPSGLMNIAQASSIEQK